MPPCCTVSPASAAWMIRVASAGLPARVCSSARLIAVANWLFMSVSPDPQALGDAVLQGHLDRWRGLQRAQNRQ